MLKNKIVWSLMVAMVLVLSAFYFGGNTASAETAIDGGDDGSGLPSCVAVSRVCALVQGNTNIVDIPMFDFPGVYSGASVLICESPQTNSPNWSTYRTYMDSWGAVGGGGNNYVACHK